MLFARGAFIKYVRTEGGLKVGQFCGQTVVLEIQTRGGGSTIPMILRTYILDESPQRADDVEAQVPFAPMFTFDNGGNRAAAAAVVRLPAHPPPLRLSRDLSQSNSNKFVIRRPEGRRPTFFLSVAMLPGSQNLYASQNFHFLQGRYWATFLS